MGAEQWGRWKKLREEMTASSGFLSSAILETSSIPGILLEIQNTGPNSDLPNPNLHFNKIPR